mmetsp:Transcript_123449/g.348809  ORF Transcript_123449/g.348809 Transcript_123449/m.348809 type:complete len:554 (-) Transcript_123449:143-1804(-)
MPRLPSSPPEPGSVGDAAWAQDFAAALAAKVAQCSDSRNDGQTGYGLAAELPQCPWSRSRSESRSGRGRRRETGRWSGRRIRQKGSLDTELTESRGRECRSRIEGWSLTSTSSKGLAGDTEVVAQLPPSPPEPGSVEDEVWVSNYSTALFAALGSTAECNRDDGEEQGIASLVDRVCSLEERSKAEEPATDAACPTKGSQVSTFVAVKEEPPTSAASPTRAPQLSTMHAEGKRRPKSATKKGKGQSRKMLEAEMPQTHAVVAGRQQRHFTGVEATAPPRSGAGSTRLAFQAVDAPATPPKLVMLLDEEPPAIAAAMRGQPHVQAKWGKLAAAGYSNGRQLLSSVLLDVADDLPSTKAEARRRPSSVTRREARCVLSQPTSVNAPSVPRLAEEEMPQLVRVMNFPKGAPSLRGSRGQQRNQRKSAIASTLRPRSRNTTARRKKIDITFESSDDSSEISSSYRGEETDSVGSDGEGTESESNDVFDVDRETERLWQPYVVPVGSYLQPVSAKPSVATAVEEVNGLSNNCERDDLVYFPGYGLVSKEQRDELRAMQ